MPHHCSPRRARRLLAPLFALAWLAGGAWAQSPITIDLGLSAGEPGETVEVSVGLAVGDTAPASMILVILLDTDAVTLNTDFYQAAGAGKAGVAAGPALAAAGKQIDANLDGRELIVVITGASSPAIQSGGLFDMALDIHPGVARGAIIPLRGSMESSATGLDGGTLIPINFEPGSIAVGCDPVDAPQGLSATQNLSDRVELNWNAIAEGGAQYRVYRARVNDVDQAVALGAWQPETAFTDTTALPAVENRFLGCLPGETVTTRYYYFVRARAVDGCQSAFAGPAVGLRAAPPKAAVQQSAGHGDAIGLGLALFALAFAGRSRRRGPSAQ